MSHTPGPWEVANGSSIVFAVNDKRNEEGHREAVAVCTSELKPIAGCKYGDERDANALLIAAAPDLLFALKMLLADIEDYQRINLLGGENNHSQVTARAAIAKAEGK